MLLRRVPKQNKTKQKVLTPTAKEQKILDAIESMSATGKLTRKRNVTVIHNDDDDGQGYAKNQIQQIDDGFQSLVQDLLAKPSRRNSAVVADDPRRRAAFLEKKRVRGEVKTRNDVDYDDDDDDDHDEDEYEQGKKATTSPSAATSTLLSAVNSAPFESLVTQYEAASSHLPANLAGRFQDSVFPESHQLATLIEQWVSAEGLGASGGGGGGGGSGFKAVRKNLQQQQQQLPQQQQRRQSSVSTEQAPEDTRTTTTTNSVIPASSTVGLSNASKARLRNLLEQSLTDFVQRLQSSVLSEIEVVSIASAQVVARGGILSHQYEAIQQELLVAKKEIARVHESAANQAARMKQLAEDSKLRDEQFDLVRQQLASREEMLREATSTFRKELNRFRSRISDLESEVERRHHSSVPVVAHWGYRSPPSPQQQQQQYNQLDSGNNNNNNNNTVMNHPSSSSSPQASLFAGTLRPHQSPSSTLHPSHHHLQQQQQQQQIKSSLAGLVVAEPDPRGVLAAAAAMDQLTNNNNISIVNTTPMLSSSIMNADQQQQQLQHLNSNNRNFDNFSFMHHNALMSPPHGGQDSNNLNSSSRSFVSPAPTTTASQPPLTVPQIIQLASSAGMEEAVSEMRREFDRKLFAVKERFMQDKRESLAQLKSKQEMSIQQLRRDVEEKDRELKLLREAPRDDEGSFDSSPSLHHKKNEKIQHQQHFVSAPQQVEYSSNSETIPSGKTTKKPVKKTTKK